MKFNRLSLVNFRSYTSTKLSLGRVTVVRGTNAVGKTSIADAIEYTLTGHNRLTDGAGRGAETMIRTGAASFTVELEHEAGPTITLTRTSRGTNLIVCDNDFGSPKNFNGAQARGWIEANLGSADVLSAVLNSTYFVDMRPEFQAVLLANALRPDPVAVPDEICRLQAKHKLGFTKELRSAPEVDFHYKAAFEERTAVGREVKALGEVGKPPEDDELPTVADVESKLNALQAQRHDIAQQRTSRQAAYLQAKGETERNAGRAARLRQEIADFERAIVSEAEFAALTAAAKNRTRVSTLDKKIASAEATLGVLKRELIGMGAVAEACPTCRRAYEPQDISGAKERRRDKELEIEQAERQLEDLRSERRKLGDPDTAERKVAQYREAVAGQARAKKDLEELAAATPPAAPDTAKEDAALAELDERLANGRSVLKQVTEARAALAQYERNKAVLDARKEKHADLTTIVEFLGNPQLKAKMIGGRLPAFMEKLNQVLGRFGYECRLNLEPYQLAVFGPGQGIGLTLAQLSESQRLRFSVALQVALAETTGVRFIVIDRADMLVDSAREDLMEALLDSELDQAIVLATYNGDEPSRDVPDIPGVVWINLTTGEGGATSVQAVTGAEERAHA